MDRDEAQWVVAIQLVFGSALVAAGYVFQEFRALIALLGLAGIFAGYISGAYGLVLFRI